MNSLKSVVLSDSIGKLLGEGPILLVLLSVGILPSKLSMSGV